jgi:hypothetical protein
MPNYRIVYTVTKKEDQDWWIRLTVSSANNTTADPRDALIKDDGTATAEILAKIRDPSRWKRISYSDYTWDRTWIDDNTIEFTYNFQSADKLQGFYLDWHEFSLRPHQYYTKDWKAFAPDGTAITLPSIS